MILKKINAVLAILSAVTLLIHISYCSYAYFSMYYNEALKFWTAIPFMVLTCLHAVCGMCTVFLQGDGTRLDTYPRQNIRTILQRVSAALIFPLLILHLNTFGLMSSRAESGDTFMIIVLMIVQVLFFADVTIHTVISFSKAFITLGLLKREKTRKVLDRVMYVFGTVVFLVASFVVVKGEIDMFMH